MNTRQTFALLEKVYARRKKIADAKMQSLETSVRQYETQIKTLQSQVAITKDTHDAHVLELIKSAQNATHFHGISSAIAAEKLRHNDQIILMRYNTLRARERRDEVAEKREKHRSEVRNVSRKSTKFETLIDQENRDELQRAEALEEEITLEVQSNMRSQNAR